MYGQGKVQGRIGTGRRLDRRAIQGMVEGRISVTAAMLRYYAPLTPFSGLPWTYTNKRAGKDPRQPIDG